MHKIHFELIENKKIINTFSSSSYSSRETHFATVLVVFYMLAFFFFWVCYRSCGQRALYYNCTPLDSHTEIVAVWFIYIRILSSFIYNIWACFFLLFVVLLCHNSNNPLEGKSCFTRDINNPHRIAYWQREDGGSSVYNDSFCFPHAHNKRRAFIRVKERDKEWARIEERERDKLILYWMCRVNFGFSVLYVRIYIYIYVVKAYPLGVVDKRHHNFVKSLHVSRRRVSIRFR